MDKIKLFCLPYAGGSATVYHGWRRYLGHNIELHPVELAGRGKRFKVPFYENMHEAIDDIFNFIRKDLENGGYILFGHSMGGQLAYELCYKIKEASLPGPRHIFLSGRRPPHRVKIKPEKILHNLPEAEFKKEIGELGGTPQEFFEHQELLDLFLPILRADYKILETYDYAEKEDRLDCPITIFSGTEDTEALIEEMREWDRYTTKEFQSYQMAGGHFFLHEHAERIVGIINSALL